MLVLLCILSKMVFCSRSSDSFLIFSLVYLTLTLRSQTPFVVHIDLIALIKGLIALFLIAYIYFAVLNALTVMCLIITHAIMTS